ncbi:hypothetical protein [Chryseobacterium balustinum]|uniref:Predicted integral membrane protein n=1 Tax=Chryseobacterium balustinum TaxID=246 RepID=A0AAX2IHI7_9FLAO|nr:hypothetical protein [Chryseobacterium balustinum]AZB31192.1 hypothetical protein EB354_19080 [Chryseobacterium balustinum]SKB38876.1 hypothetical protein SAMN05421800_101343 [Chryseobacterium balustinum]SQA87922.1 Predicted integral membrane protein [Chryseobacterium balustinum]
MNVNLTLKPINFKFGEYINKGFELLKKDFGGVFVGFLVTLLMSIIPFCGLLAVGNYYKYLRKLTKNQPASAGEIFDFKDFMPYFILQLIIFGGMIVLYIPMIFIAVIGGAASYGSDEPSVMGPILMFPYMFIIFAVILYFALKGFYIPALITFKGVTDIKTAWNISKVMTKGNLLNIFLFSFVVGILSQIGVIACGIGLFLTLPFMYAANYFAFEDAIQQIEYDEITEIGITEKY